MTLQVLNANSPGKAGFLDRVAVLRRISREVIDRLQRDGLYGEDPASEAFIRTHNESCRAWNLDEWNRKRHSY